MSSIKFVCLFISLFVVTIVYSDQATDTDKVKAWKSLVADIAAPAPAVPSGDNDDDSTEEDDANDDDDDDDDAVDARKKRDTQAAARDALAKDLTAAAQIIGQQSGAPTNDNNSPEDANDTDDDNDTEDDNDDDEEESVETTEDRKKRALTAEQYQTAIAAFDHLASQIHPVHHNVKRRSVSVPTQIPSNIPAELKGAAAIFFDPNLTRTQRKQQLDAWVAQQTPAVQAEFNTLATNMTNQFHDFCTAMDAKLPTLSPEAQAAATQLKAVFQNSNNSWTMIGQQVKDIVSGMSSTARKELWQAYTSASGLGDGVATKMAAFFTG